MLKYLNSLKSQYQFKGLGFETDLIRLYQEVKTMMAKHYITGEIGPVAASGAEEDIETYMKIKIADKKKAIKIGYERAKQRVKDVRQDYRKAVNESRLSRSVN